MATKPTLKLIEASSNSKGKEVRYNTYTGDYRSFNIDGVKAYLYDNLLKYDGAVLLDHKTETFIWLVPRRCLNISRKIVKLN